MTWMLWIPAVLAAFGTGLLTWTVLDALADLPRRLGRRRRMLAALRQRREQKRSNDMLSEEELYGLPRSLMPWMALAAMGGLALSWALMDGPAQGVGVAAGVAPLLWKRRRIGMARQEIRRQVADLIQEMRLRLSFGGSLGAVLNGIAAEGREGIVYERLRFHRRLITLSGPETVLERLAEDLRSGELRMLIRRVRAASRGGSSYSDALRAAADEVAAEVHRQAEVEVEGAPLRLLFPMLIGLLPPVLAMALYPPAYGLIASLSGAGPSVMP